MTQVIPIRSLSDYTDDEDDDCYEYNEVSSLTDGSLALDDYKSELNSNEPDYPYHEVVRKKADRAKLQPGFCRDCEAFCKVFMSGKGREVFKESDLVECSRHHSKFVTNQPSTPEDFWELSFIDEIKARERREKEKKRLQKLQQHPVYHK